MIAAIHGEKCRELNDGPVFKGYGAGRTQNLLEFYIAMLRR